MPFFFFSNVWVNLGGNTGRLQEAISRSDSNAVPATLAIFPRRASADPVEVHDVRFAAFRAKAFHFGFVMVDHDIRIFIDAFLGWFAGGLHGFFSLGRWHIQTLRQ
jgi:hypothetical protein